MTTDRLRHWHRLVSSLRTRSLKRTESADASDLTNEALDLHDRLLSELSRVSDECDRFRAEARMRFASWEQLFDEMPMACLVTDRAGHIVRANRAAGGLLNISAKHLTDRELVLFSQDRVAFESTISRLRDGERTLRCQLGLRPRDRKPAAFDGTVLATVEEGAGTYLWFLAPAQERDANAVDAREHSRAARRSPGPRLEST